MLYVQALINGVLLGATYGLMALGLSGQKIFAFAGQAGNVGLGVVVAIFVGVIIVAGFLLGGREQFAEEEEEEFLPAPAR